MDWLQAFILGIMQGLTEFLPISSSGHLVLAQHILGVETPGILLEVVLHMGTLAAILIYFYDDIKQLLQSVIKSSENAREYTIYLIIATIPSICVGLLFRDIIETSFTVSIVKWMLMITGLVVGSTYFFKNKPRRELVMISALCIGFAQIFALLPGISRSGMTISVALIMGIQQSVFNATDLRIYFICSYRISGYKLVISSNFTGEILFIFPILFRCFPFSNYNYQLING